MRYLLLAAAAALLAGCGRQSGAPMPKAIVDLSSPLAEDTPVKQVGAKFLKEFHYRETTKFEHNVMEDPMFVQDSYITLLNHVGPHLDPPNHMIKGAKSVDQIPLDKLFGAAKVFDLRAKPKDSPLVKADFEGKGIAPGDIVIAFVGYTPPAGPEEWPSYAYLSGEAAEYLASIPIRAFASDMPSLGSIRRYPALMASGTKGSDKLAPEHYAFLSREIPNIEGLTNLESIVGKQNVVFVGFPLKIKDGNGGPMRAAALLY
jgi:Predicted metal-dependent hydrolase